MKNYLIIGASSGIGKALAELLATNRHQVIGTYFQTAVTNAKNLNYYPLDVMTKFDLDFLPAPTRWNRLLSLILLIYYLSNELNKKHF